ncbi:VOC family protein [Novosphingobium sp. P6W]|uniref:VOC family protein n=1 Tax=Novosphingobium sp. P6W TaxID=1609758 RepID=UPI0005C2FCE6|nr:VOC family protein [Novosphingobium sp. P6W]AXB79585.1 VOC family protein [Novosphingobium sp. P6W]KIS34324.1 methylmalonyl-CoA epimerase [Novosphingobium sp. P6W]
MKRALFQQAWFVTSIDEAARKWSDAFGAGPFCMVRHHHCDEFTYRGTAQEADVSYAFGYLGDMMIQFIEQHDEKPSIYRDMFAPGEEGFHHVAYLVSDFAAERRRWIDMGYVLATELYADEVNAAYFDTRELNGGFTEIHGDPPHIMGLFAHWKRLHDNRASDTPPAYEMEDLAFYQQASLLEKATR